MNRRENTIILYGSYGYTGSLIARECLSRNLNVILSGRSADALKAQHAETGYAFEVVDLSDSSALRSLLLKGRVLIHCGGPFQYTAKVMADMCIETKTHYTDITGEYQVFEMLATCDGRAKAAGITILPGTGFDVVPTDCLAVFLKNQLPGATHLQLAFAMSQGGLSRGTAKTTVEGLGKNSVIRKGGKLVEVSLGNKIIEIDFGLGRRKCLNIPWGDVSTAWHSTGIPHIEVYMAAGSTMIKAAKITRYIQWLLVLPWMKKRMLRYVDRKKSGPAEAVRNSTRSYVWGKVWDDAGNSRSTTLETISGYTLTAKASVLIAEKILNNHYKAGFQTPGKAYGQDFILEIKSTIRKIL